jgi:nickel transport protein
LLVPVARAHDLSLFASAEGDQIQGSVRYAGGGPAPGVSVRVLDPQGRVLAQLTSDNAGRFHYRARERIDHRLVAATGEGHGAQWMLRADELPSALARPSGDGPAATPGADPGVALEGMQARSAELESMIERAVARQVRPLREELRAAEERARMSDLLGGIGYIVGIAGLALWWHARRWGRRG